jgi:hypothetical protein
MQLTALHHRFEPGGREDGAVQLGHRGRGRVGGGCRGGHGEQLETHGPPHLDRRRQLGGSPGEDAGRLGGGIVDDHVELVRSVGVAPAQGQGQGHAEPARRVVVDQHPGAATLPVGE